MHQKTKLLSGRDLATACCICDARCIDDACCIDDGVIGEESDFAAKSNETTQETTIQRNAGLPDAEVGKYFTVTGIIFTRTGPRSAKCDSEHCLKPGGHVFDTQLCVNTF